MANEYKRFSDLVKDNCGGLDEIANPHSFSNNPGFMGSSTASMLAAAGPTAPRTAGGSAPRHVAPRTGPNPVVGRTATYRGSSVANSAPGTLDPTMDGGPQGRTSGLF